MRLGSQVRDAPDCVCASHCRVHMQHEGDFVRGDKSLVIAKTDVPRSRDDAIPTQDDSDGEGDSLEIFLSNEDVAEANAGRGVADSTVGLEWSENALIAGGPRISDAVVVASRDHEPEWALYPQACYEFENRDDLKGKVRCTAAAIETDLQRKRLDYCRKNGVRRSVVGVLLCHRHEYPHALLLQHVDKRTFSLPAGKFHSWEKPKEVLKRKLNKIVKKVPSKFAAHRYTSSEEGVVEIGDYLGEWWRPEVYADPLPYLPPHVSRPKERLRLYQVILPPRCLFFLPPGYTLKSVPLFDLDPAQHGVAIGGLPHVLCRFKLHCMAETEVDATDTISLALAAATATSQSSANSGHMPMTDIACTAAHGAEKLPQDHQDFSTENGDVGFTAFSVQENQEAKHGFLGGASKSMVDEHFDEQLADLLEE